MKNVGIIAGGYSSEFEVSMKSARTIYENFPDGYHPFIVVMNTDGWKVQLSEGDVDLDLADFSFIINGDKAQLDFCIVYVHGDPGENGKIQAFFELKGMPYVNSGPLASELSFDKWYCNQFLKGLGFPVADSVYLANKSSSYAADDIVRNLGLPVFVKPCDAGSSFGVVKVKHESDIDDAVKAAFQEGGSVLIESFLDGVEVTCGVYTSKDGLKALPICEIECETEFFDFQAKYEGLSREIVPARIPDETRDEIQSMSQKVYELLNLRSIARIDFIIVNGKPVIIEVNTTPGFSPESIVPKMIKAEGQTIKAFWTEILDYELNIKA